VLDVGGAYSELPSSSKRRYACETWVVDDFGIDVNDPFWARHQSPQETHRPHPEVKYVLERVGRDPQSSFPCRRIFRCGLQRFRFRARAGGSHPRRLAGHILWGLVKPGGELLHAIDVAFSHPTTVCGTFFEIALFDLSESGPAASALSPIPISFPLPGTMPAWASQALGIGFLPKNEVSLLAHVIGPPKS